MIDCFWLSVCVSLCSWSTGRNREDIWVGETTTAGRFRLRHHQPSISADQDFAGSYPRLSQDRISEGLIFAWQLTVSLLNVSDFEMSFMHFTFLYYTCIWQLQCVPNMNVQLFAANKLNQCNPVSRAGSLCVHVLRFICVSHARTSSEQDVPVVFLTPFCQSVSRLLGHRHLRSGLIFARQLIVSLLNVSRDMDFEMSQIEVFD